MNKGASHKQIIFATKNKAKLREIKEIFAGLGLSVLSMEEAGHDFDIEETGATFKENAEIKAAALCGASGKPAMADDSGLEVDYLNKEPGVYSARFLGADTSYDVKNAHIIDALKGVPTEKRTARFVCAICAAFPDGRIITEEAALEGIIADAPKGDNGFGYDPIFYVPEYGQTTAEMPPELKNEISHRGKALKQMLRHF